MIQEINLKGEWWKPGRSERLSGVLTYNLKEGARLEIFGTFNKGVFDHMPHEVVLGQTLDGLVTLLDCNFINKQASNENGLVISGYQPSMIFRGHLFEEKKDIVFNLVKFGLFNLREWLNRDGLNEKRRPDNYSAEYEKPADILFKYHNGCKGKLSFSLNVEYTNYPYGRQISQNAEIEFKYDSKQGFQKILNDIFSFVGFVTLCTYEQSYPLEIKFYSNDIFSTSKHARLEQKIPKKIECIYRNSFYKDSYKILKGQQLIHFKSVENNFENIIHAWFVKSAELGPVIKLLLSSFLDKYTFSNEKFMDIVRALEVFHRHHFSNEKVPPEEFRRRRNSFFNETTTKLDKKWLREKLQHANEPTLYDRLMELISNYSFPYFVERVSDINKFCTEAKDSRNYLTHFNPRLKSKCLKFKELFDLYENLKLLLFSCVFKSIGLDAKDYEKSMRMNVY